MAVRSQMCGADPGQVCSSMSAARNVGKTLVWLATTSIV